jgi:Cytochrome c554 and c-prime
MRASAAASALSAACLCLFLCVFALPALSESQASSDSKWLSPEKDLLMRQQKTLVPFYPHRANTTDNHLLPASDFDNVNEVCSACHTDIYAQWRTSIMSRSWDDPIYRALLKRASEATNGAIDNFCTGCHTPIGLTTGQITPAFDREPLEKTAAEHPLPGVDCETCHNISARTGQDNGAYVLTPMLNGKPTKFGSLQGRGFSIPRHRVLGDAHAVGFLQRLP